GMTILAPEGMLGYGIPVRSMAEGMKRNPDAIAVDAGSTDPGPYYLGAGVPFTNRRAFKRDLGMILDAARERRVPVLIGSAGGGGGPPPPPRARPGHPPSCPRPGPPLPPPGTRA